MISHNLGYGLVLIYLLGYCQITYESSCFVLIPRKMSWYAARQNCESLGGTLAEVKNAQLNVILKDMWQGKIKIEGKLIYGRYIGITKSYFFFANT